MTNDIDAERSAARLKRWVVDQALPLWGETGFDSARGSFVERLTFEGAPVHSAPRRAMVQARCEVAGREGMQGRCLQTGRYQSHQERS